jgi:hypothetical protein
VGGHRTAGWFLPVRFPTTFFNNNVAVATALYIDNLTCTHLEPQWLMAQSVPSASLVPCVPGLFGAGTTWRLGWYGVAQALVAVPGNACVSIVSTRNGTFVTSVLRGAVCR